VPDQVRGGECPVRSAERSTTEHRSADREGVGRR